MMKVEIKIKTEIESSVSNFGVNGLKSRIFCNGAAVRARCEYAVKADLLALGIVIVSQSVQVIMAIYLSINVRPYVCTSSVLGVVPIATIPPFVVWVFNSFVRRHRR